MYTESEASFVISHVIFTETIQASNRGFIWNAFFCSTHAPTPRFKRHITTRLPDYPPVAEPCCRPIACLTTHLMPTNRLSDCPPVADPSPVRLPACCRPIACPTARLLPTHRLSDCPPVANPSPVQLPACCRPLACPTTCLLPYPRRWLVVIPLVSINPTVFSSRLRLPVFSLWVHSSCTITRTGARAFSYQAPLQWNQLPVVVREADTLFTFKSRLKTFLFDKAYS